MYYELQTNDLLKKLDNFTIFEFNRGLNICEMSLENKKKSHE